MYTTMTAWKLLEYLVVLSLLSSLMGLLLALSYDVSIRKLTVQCHSVYIIAS